MVRVDPGMAETRIPPSPPSSSRSQRVAAVRSLPARLVGRITTAEWIVGGLVAALMLVLVVLEPDILEVPVENYATGRFRADMTVHVENDGPITILIDSRRLL